MKHLPFFFFGKYWKKISDDSMEMYKCSSSK